MSTSTTKFQHADGCRKARDLDVTEYADHGITTTRCVDCGAHEARDRDGKALRIPTASGALAGAGDAAGITVQREDGAA